VHARIRTVDARIRTIDARVLTVDALILTVDARILTTALVGKGRQVHRDRPNWRGRRAKQLPYIKVLRLPGGLVLKAHRRVHHSTLGVRVTKKKKKSPV